MNTNVCFSLSISLLRPSSPFQQSRVVRVLQIPGFLPIPRMTESRQGREGSQGSSGSLTFGN